MSSSSTNGGPFPMQRINERRAASPFCRFFQSLVYFVFLGVCVEIALQGFYFATAGDFLFRRVELPIYARESYGGYGNRPGLSFEHRTSEFSAQYDVNQAGFRVPGPEVEVTQVKPFNTYRIMLLGPSFAFGWGVHYQQSFAGVLQQVLEQRGFANDKKVEVINAGIPAMPVAPQVVWFEQVGKLYAPDLVIQFVYGSMAISSQFQPSVQVNDEGYLVSMHDKSGLHWKRELKKLATIFYGWQLWTMLDRTPAQVGERGSAVQGAGREWYVPPEFDPTSQEVRESMRVYTRLARTTGTGGSRLLVIFFPLSYAIHREDESRWRHLGVVDIAREATFDDAFVQYLNENQIATIDITKQLRDAAESGERMYYWLDIHWTPAGNAVAARAVADHLSTNSFR